MSVYIKGLEMPKNCRECPLEQPYDGYNCYINEKSYSWGLSSRPSDCPLIPVPDHGDLIERDALKKECQENAKRGIGLWVDYMDVSLAPTIIPASKEDGE